MGVLILSEQLREDVARVRAYAARRENLYDLMKFMPPGSKAGDYTFNTPDTPGNKPGHVFKNGTFKCVFSWTRDENGEVFRHFTVSTASGPGGGFPMPAMVFTLAYMLGFTGVEPDDNGMVWQPPTNRSWMLHPNKEERCVIVAQKLGKNPWADDKVGAAEARAVPGPGTAQ